MAITGSGIFRSTIVDQYAGTAIFDLDAPSDTYKAALFNNTGTPDKDATSANTAYNAGQWVTANEVYHAGQWAQGGIAMTGLTFTAPASGVAMFDAADVASGSAAVLANVYGVQVYNDTKTTPVADQGVCWNYLGGANSIAGGTFTVVWNTNGIFRISV